MIRAIAIATILLAGCTAAQQQAAITIAENAMPCYAAVKAATSAANTASNVLNGSVVVASYPACAAVDAATAELIASAINANAAVVAAPVSAAAARPKP